MAAQLLHDVYPDGLPEDITAALVIPGPDKPSLFERLGGIFAIAAVVNHFSDAVLASPRVGVNSPNPQLREWSRSQSAARLPGLKFERTLWVADITGGPYKFAGTHGLPVGDLNLEKAHRALRITSAEFDEVVQLLAISLSVFHVPTPERTEVLAAFIAHKAEVVAGSAGGDPVETSPVGNPVGASPVVGDPCGGCPSGTVCGLCPTSGGSVPCCQSCHGTGKPPKLEGPEGALAHSATQQVIYASIIAALSEAKVAVDSFRIWWEYTLNAGGMSMADIRAELTTMATWKFSRDSTTSPPTAPNAQMAKYLGTLIEDLNILNSQRPSPAAIEILNKSHATENTRLQFVSILSALPTYLAHIQGPLAMYLGL
jgi:hemoglobin